MKPRIKVLTVLIAVVASVLASAACSGPKPTPTAPPTSAPTAAPTPVPSTGTPVTEEAQPIEPEMVLIAAGAFAMGSDPGLDPDAAENELPQHTLSLDDYYLARTPVTNAQYAVFVQATGHRVPYHWKNESPPRGAEEHPVVNVSWHDAVVYSDWLSERTGKPYRLPSEAEWERGARGSDARIYPWGSEWDAARCNSRESSRGETVAVFGHYQGSTTPVGAYRAGASPDGLLDMAGNVWEWTTSAYAAYPYDPDDGREDPQAGDEVQRVIRGGASVNLAWRVRCAYRGKDLPAFGFYDRGFRLAMDAR